MSEEKPEKEATEETKDAVTEAQERELWREGLIQEALGARPELNRLAARRDFAASRQAGYDRGFEDGARKLTFDQLKAFQTLKDRRLATYVRHEMPGDLRDYLDDAAAGFDQSGFLAGYVDGVGDFVTEVQRRLNQPE